MPSSFMIPGFVRDQIRVDCMYLTQPSFFLMEKSEILPGILNLQKYMDFSNQKNFFCISNLAWIIFIKNIVKCIKQYKYISLCS